MIKLFPVYYFEFESTLNKNEVKLKLLSLLKKQEKKSKKFEIFIMGQDFGAEEFQGKVEEDKFKLMRYKCLLSDHLKIIVYQGKIESTKNGSLIKCVFRFEFTIFIMLIAMAIYGGVNIFNAASEINARSIENIVGIIILSVGTYGVFIAGFNYRIKKVRELLIKKIGIFTK